VKLAINGGDPVRTEPFPAYVTVGSAEEEAVAGVIQSGILSKYLGCWHEQFYGGSQVQALEEEWAAYFDVKHAIAVNSCTSGLYCAVGAAGVEPGEEVIVSPYTMSASATAPLVFNAIPVFADIEEDYFCLNVDAIEACITPRTRAVIVVDIFGLPYDAEGINRLAKRHGLTVIEDCAQAPGARSGARYAGTLGDIGVYSLNYHKHIHCGEGGVVVTDDDEIAERVRLIRNHAEAVVEGKGTANLSNMLGFNFRMTELEAAVARCQLRRLETLLAQRRDNVAYLEESLGAIPALVMPSARESCSHAYYVHAIKYRGIEGGITRDVFADAVRAELPVHALRENEGVKLGCGYAKPLYLQPMFQKKIAYGSRGCPFVAPWYDGAVDYSKGICPVAERMYEKEVITHEFMLPSMGHKDMDDVLAAFEKVWNNREELRAEV